MMSVLFTLILFVSSTILLHGLSIQPPSTPRAIKNKGTSISIVTGANGYVGRHVVYSLLSRQSPTTNDKHSYCVQQEDADEIIICLVRPRRIPFEESYWNAQLHNLQRSNKTIKVMPYDMLDGGASLDNAFQWGRQHYRSTNPSPISLCLYHVASTFGPTPDPIQTAQQNVQSAQDAVRSLTKLINSIQNDGEALPKLRMVLTSSMAAVRATNQLPLNGKYYTHKDWNTLSKLDSENWGSCYQWSKAE
jgi:nucleoside-diphosphate-sugar epimerase